MKYKIYLIFSIFLMGCSIHWEGPGSDTEFYTDEAECQSMGAQSDNAIVRYRIYEGCMKGRGWTKRGFLERFKD